MQFKNFIILSVLIGLIALTFGTRLLNKNNNKNKISPGLSNSLKKFNNKKKFNIFKFSKFTKYAKYKFNFFKSSILVMGNISNYFT